ncbi:hypothetical protein [Sphingobacterium endophyticum]|uniref:hypothetical protein n=1 Tax=Sphingobacterium endophyticum TaxID=2546448 RepID=UPI0012E2CB45|nr:hypothetical protein [Sphingobacterium endophyticum]
MKKLLFPIFVLTLSLSSCAKDEFNVEDDFKIINSKWEGKGHVGGSPDQKQIKLEFLDAGKLKGFYDPNNWEGTYNFNLETKRGVILEEGELEMPFEVYGDSLKFEIIPGDWIIMVKVK